MSGNRAAKFLRRKITVLIIPHSRWAPIRFHLSAAFFLFLFLSWSAVTLIGGFLASRSIDYWITKTDNQVLKLEVAYFASEIYKAKGLLTMARKTDSELRQLLGMRSRKAIIEAESEEAAGGPTWQDRLDLRQILSQKAGILRQPQFKKELDGVLDRTEKRLASFQEIAWHITNQKTLYRSTPNLWPAEGHLTSPFGYRFSPFGHGEEGQPGEFHTGIDIANRPDTPVHAAADGVVRFAGWKHGYGRMILIDHGAGYSTLYGHTSKFLARQGDRVSRGQVIAYMGMTGRSTGDHLHYEVWMDGRPVNPFRFLKVRPQPDQDDQLAQNR